MKVPDPLYIPDLIALVPDFITPKIALDLLKFPGLPNLFSLFPNSFKFIFLPYPHKKSMHFLFCANVPGSFCFDAAGVVLHVSLPHAGLALFPLGLQFEILLV